MNFFFTFAPQLSQESTVVVHLLSCSYVSVAEHRARITPNSQKKVGKMRVILETADMAALREIVKNSECVQMDNTPTSLSFRVDYGKRHDIMMAFVKMVSDGLVDDTEKNLVRWLSETTNMGSYESVRQLYYRCQREYVRK